VVVAPEDVGDPKLGVVDDAAEVVGRRSVGLDQDLVLDVLRVDLDPAVDQVVVGDFPAGGDAIEDRLPFPVSPAGGRQGFGFLPIQIEPAALAHRLAVPVQAEPSQVLEDLVEETLFGADLVGVFDAEKETASGAAGRQPVEQGGPGAPEMQKTGGARSETDDQGCVHGEKTSSGLYSTSLRRSNFGEFSADRSQGSGTSSLFPRGFPRSLSGDIRGRKDFLL